MKINNLMALSVVAVLGAACSPQKTPHNTASQAGTVAKASPYNPQTQQATYNQIPEALPIGHQLPSAGVMHAPKRSVPQAGPSSHRPVYTAHNSHGSGISSLSRGELQLIGQQIFRNEGGGNIKRLVHWNVGEDFASMGIGHFTWYPSGRRQRFGNTFPGLLDYMTRQGVQLPAWVEQARHQGAPWRTRSQYLRASNSPEVRELQQFLYQTRDIQAKYIVERAKRAMPRLVKASDRRMQSKVGQNLNALANSPGGWYALIDYVNFKGEGLAKSGGYRGQNWGLRQVLEEMRPSGPGPQALNEFADAAIRVLHRRVQNSDPSRNEARWLPGWQNRINTYRNPMV